MHLVPRTLVVIVAKVSAVLLGALLLTLSTLPAQADGTRAWSTSELILHEGPGGTYNQVGIIADDSRIQVDRCQRLWCVVRAHGVKGWALLQNITFGQSSRNILTGPRLNYGGGGGEMCLYEGTNYTGRSFCARSGQVFRDLLSYGVDNRYSSIKLTGDTSVALCRDREFQSYCARIVESQPVLQQYLNNGVSSVRVY